MKLLYKAALLLCLSTLLLFTGCAEKASNQESNQKNKIVIGTTAIPNRVLEVAKEDFEKNSGMEMEIKTFNDVFLPNVALEEGSIDANFYQHLPFLEEYNQSNGTHLVNPTRKYYDIPIGLYSQKYKSIDEIPDGATIAIYSEASNKGRVLQILEAAGLIKLNSEVQYPGTLDITENRKNLKFVELDSDAKLTSSLSDVDAAVIYKQGMVLAQMDPSTSILPEIKDDTFAIILAVKDGNQNAEWIKQLDAALTSDKVRDFILTEFKGALQPLF